MATIGDKSPYHSKCSLEIALRRNGRLCFLPDSPGRNWMSEDKFGCPFPNDTVQGSILSPHRRPLLPWRSINLHMQFHDCPVEREERS